MTKIMQLYIQTGPPMDRENIFEQVTDALREIDAHEGFLSVCQELKRIENEYAGYDHETGSGRDWPDTSKDAFFILQNELSRLCVAIYEWDNSWNSDLREKIEAAAIRVAAMSVMFLKHYPDCD